MFVCLNLKRNVGDRKWIESEGLAQQNDLMGEFSKRIIPPGPIYYENEIHQVDLTSG